MFHVKSCVLPLDDRAYILLSKEEKKYERKLMLILYHKILKLSNFIYYWILSP